MNVDLDQVRSLLDASAVQAESIMNDPSRVDDILVGLEEKLKEVPAIGSTLSELPVMIAMVKGYVTKEYTEVSPKVIAAILGSFIYLVKKEDLISDKVPVLGLVDDMAVVGLALNLCKKELGEFSAWRKNRSDESALA